MSGAIAVLGAGGFGWGLARAAVGLGTDVVLWSRRPPPLEGPERITVTAELRAAAELDLLLMAVPGRHARGLLRELEPHVDGRHAIVHVSRGLADDEVGLRTLADLVLEHTAVRRVGVLAGPLVPDDLAQGRPGGAIVGTDFPDIVESLRAALGGPGSGLRLYESDDRLGVELASALVGALLFTVGYARGLGVGGSALATLATRGLAEIARLGRAMGARHETFFGLAGLGDLLAAIAGTRRPEVVLGELLAEGAELPGALDRLGAHVEAVAVARRVTRHAREIGIEMPIASVVAEVLAGERSGAEALSRLMARTVGRE